jgi:hypothetical protein
VATKRGTAIKTFAAFAPQINDVPTLVGSTMFAPVAPLRGALLFLTNFLSSAALI